MCVVNLGKTCHTSSIHTKRLFNKVLISGCSNIHTIIIIYSQWRSWRMTAKCFACHLIVHMCAHGCLDVNMFLPTHDYFSSLTYYELWQYAMEFWWHWIQLVLCILLVWEFHCFLSHIWNWYAVQYCNLRV